MVLGIFFRQQMSERAKRIICRSLDVRKTSNIHWRNTNVCDAASNKWTLGATGLTSSKLKVCGCFVFLLKRIFKGTSCVGCSLNWSLNPCVWVQCIVNCVTSSRKRLMWSCKHPVAASNAQRDLQTNKTEKESESVCRCASKLTFRFRIFTNLSSTWTASLPPSRLSLEDSRNCGCRFNTIL